MAFRQFSALSRFSLRSLRLNSSAGLHMESAEPVSDPLPLSGASPTVGAARAARDPRDEDETAARASADNAGALAFSSNSRAPFTFARSRSRTFALLYRTVPGS